MRAAGDDTPTLPEDPAALRALLLSAWAERDALATRCDGVAAERDALAARNDRLQHLLLKLQRRQFGRKSERLPEDQLLFAFEEIEATLAANAAEEAKRSPGLRDGRAKRRRAGRGRLPAHLPRVEVVVELGIQRPLGQRLLQPVQQAALGQGRSGIRPAQELVQQLIRDRGLLASWHTMAPSAASYGPKHGISDSPPAPARAGPGGGRRCRGPSR